MSLRPLELGRPFDIALSYAAAERHRTKGMFFSDYVKELSALGETWPKRYVAFKEYPVKELVGLVERLAQRRAPDKPLRETWHAISRNQYPALRASVVGKVLFGIVGNDPEAVLRLAARGYAVALSGAGPVSVIDVSHEHVRAELRGQSLPLEGWHSGVWAGALESLGCEMTSVSVDLDDEFNGLIELRWRR